MWIRMLAYAIRFPPVPFAVGAVTHAALLSRHIRVEQQDQLAPAFFTIAGVIGVVAGFMGAAVLFIAVATGPGIGRIRRQHGRKLNGTLLAAMGWLLLAALVATGCGLFSNGWFAQASMTGVVLLVVTEAAKIGLALKTAMDSEADEADPTWEDG